MKLRFFIPVFALFFILSCGDDPISDEFNDEDQQTIENDENSQPDDGNSENGNDSDSDTDTDSDKTDDNADSTDDSGDSQPDKDADDTDSDDDSDNNVADDNDTNDTDADTDTNDTETDTDTNDTDADTDTNDTETDTDTNDTDADTDTNDTDSGDDELEVVLPYNGGTVEKTINFNTKINKIDVLLLVDVGHTSMSTAHDNLKANKDSLIDGIRTKIPDSAFGLVNFGLFGENVYDLVQPITTDKNDFKNKINTIAPKTTGLKRYHTHALWEAASGEADYEQVAHKVSGTTQYSSINIPAVDCSGQEGTIGGACFRDNSMPVFVMATNSAFNDLTYDNFGEWKVGEKKTKQKAAEKMNEINAKFIGFSLATLSTSKLPEDLGDISENTDSLTLSNENFVISETTSDNWATKIAETVTNLTANIKLDVKAEFKHVDNEYGVENTVQFKKSIYPEAGQTVKAGDTVSFDVTFENKIHENNDCEPHIFYITIEALGEGLVLDSRTIKIVVPGKEENCGSAQ
jgi:AAA ATPase containing von Willebrand factor type A (vWA) domain